MSDKSKDKLRTEEDYDLELEQMLLDCCDSMSNSDVKGLMNDIHSRVCFAKGYLHEFKPIQEFLYFILEGERSPLPF